MKIAVRCPDCAGVWHVEGSDGGEMLCPSCMTRIPLPASRGVASRERPPVADDTPSNLDLPLAPPPEPAAPAPAPAPVEYAPPQSFTEGQVVCPRCNLHFHPRQLPRQRPSERHTVLVVDDLEYFRQIATDALEPTFAVKTAATSAQARELLRAGGIDLLVLDLTLDGCNAGRDLLAELTPKPCPILIFTAQDESEMYGKSWNELQSLGADDLVIKGMKVGESLLRKVSGLLGVAVDELAELP